MRAPKRGAPFRYIQVIKYPLGCSGDSTHCLQQLNYLVLQVALLQPVLLLQLVLLFLPLLQQVLPLQRELLLQLQIHLTLLMPPTRALLLRLASRW